MWPSLRYHCHTFTITAWSSCQCRNAVVIRVFSSHSHRNKVIVTPSSTYTPRHLIRFMSLSSFDLQVIIITKSSLHCSHTVIIMICSWPTFASECHTHVANYRRTVYAHVAESMEISKSCLQILNILVFSVTKGS